MSKPSDYSDEQQTRAISGARDVVPCGTVALPGDRLLLVAAMTIGQDKLVRLAFRRGADQPITMRLGPGSLVVLLRALLRAAHVAGYTIDLASLVPAPETLPAARTGWPRERRAVLIEAYDDHAEVRIETGGGDVAFGTPVDVAHADVTLRLRGGSTRRYLASDVRDVGRVQR